MSLNTLRSVRVQLALCVAGPVLALAAILIPGRVYCRHLRDDVSEREAYLAQVPEMEMELGAVRQALRAYASGANGEHAASLTLLADQAAQANEFGTRSANVEKLASEGNWSDHKVTISGSGTLRSFIGMLDYLGRPDRRFRVAQVNLKAREFIPVTKYDGDLILLSRTVKSTGSAVGEGGAKPLTPVEAHEVTGRLRERLLSLVSKTQAMPAVLDLSRLTGRKPLISVEAPAPLPVKDEGLFQLNGVISRKQKPLALTDKGVFGIGDEVNGYTIESIAEDRVVVSRKGKRETVTLYSDEVRR
jgi:hypothetical protein